MAEEGVVLYAKFRTQHRCYVYDTFSNQILDVPEDRWRVIDALLMSDPGRHVEDLAPPVNAREHRAAVDVARASGYLQPTSIERMVFAETEHALLDLIRTSIPQLSLELTEQCTSRCAYCASRTEITGGGRSMHWQTAENAVRQFVSRARKVERPFLSFWGGEPLLQFPLMERVLRFATDTYPEVPFDVTFTSNLMLMTPAIARLLRDFRVQLIVSLDGPRDLHDRFRRSAAGGGTYDATMAGLRNLRAEDEEYYRTHVSFNCVMSPGLDVDRLCEFFSSEPLLTGQRVRFSIVNGSGTTFFEDYGRWTERERRALREAYRISITAPADTRYEVVRRSAYTYFHRIATRPRVPAPPTVHPNGCCAPLLKKMHVAVDGSIHLCERCGLLNPVGNVNNGGIDEDAVLRLTREYAANSLPDCRRCWAVRLCPTCYKNWLRNGEWIRNDRDDECGRTRDALLNVLRDYSEILERNPDAFSQVGFAAV